MNAREVRLGVAVLVGTAVIGAAIRHAWPCIGEMYDGVHFNSEMPDFGEPPALVAFPWWRSNAFRAGTVACYNYDRQSEKADRRMNLARRLAAAQRAESRHRYRRARTLYARLIHGRLGEAAFWRDRIEVLDERRRWGRPAHFARYLHARDVYASSWVRPKDLDRVDKAMTAIANDPKAGFLRAHALYTIAAIRLFGSEPLEAARGFERCARLYPSSPRAESALIMAARVLLSAPRGIDKPEMAAGRRYLAVLMTRYPHTRFKADVYGWLGRIEYCKGRYDRAIAYYRKQNAESGGTTNAFVSLAMCFAAKGRADRVCESYLQMYAAANTLRAKIEAAWYLRRPAQDWRPADAQRCARVIGRDPALLQAYLEFRLNFTDTSRADLANLARLAQRTLRRRPETKLGAGVLARLAEIDYMRKAYREARRYARRALAVARPGSEAGDLALYVRAATSARSRSVAKAIADFERLISRSPKSRLVGGARENLALLYEKVDRLGDALAAYSALGYKDDVAFLLDAKMTPQQIEAFIATHPGHRLRKVATFALGMRYLRRDRFGKALVWFAKLRRHDRLDLAGVIPHHPPGDFDSDDFGYDWEREFVPQAQDPLKTARDLRALNAAVARSRTGERRAKAMYSLAAYYRKHRDLLLYNPSLWHGDRASGYGFFWNKKVETHADRLAWRKHCYEHECLARVRSLCLTIVRRYPRSQVAPSAAYTAATACFTLAGFNPWWDEEDRRVHLAAQAARLMRLVVRRYPRSKLAKPAKKYAGVYASSAEFRRRDAWYARDAR